VGRFTVHRLCLQHLLLYRGKPRPSQSAGGCAQTQGSPAAGALHRQIPLYWTDRKGRCHRLKRKGACLELFQTEWICICAFTTCGYGGLTDRFEFRRINLGTFDHNAKELDPEMARKLADAELFLHGTIIIHCQGKIKKRM
jgi:hypothetical protein